MFQEALTAIHAGDRLRARDLLTRLLQNVKDNPEYWIWMSTVVDTVKERIYCLKEALRLDPQNAAAKRGLSILGAGPAQVRRGKVGIGLDGPVILFHGLLGVILARIDLAQIVENIHRAGL